MPVITACSLPDTLLSYHPLLDILIIVHCVLLISILYTCHAWRCLPTDMARRWM